MEALVADAEAAGGGIRMCGGILADGTLLARCCCAAYRPRPESILHEPVPGPVLSVVEATSESEGGAIALAMAAPSVSVWSGDRARGERVARSLGVELAWVNEHGTDRAPRCAGPATSRAPARLAADPVAVRALAPVDPALVRASTAARRSTAARTSASGVLRSGAVPLARTAARLAREALGR